MLPRLIDLLRGIPVWESLVAKITAAVKEEMKPPATDQQEFFDRVLARVAEQHRAGLDAQQATMHFCICRVLRKRLGVVPHDVEVQLDRIAGEALDTQLKLNDLLDVALGCRSLDEFRTALAKLRPWLELNGQLPPPPK